MITKTCIDWFNTALNNKSLIEKLKKISFIIADVDGSLTDGSLHYDSDGEADRLYSPQDGFGMRMAIDNGVKIAILSGNAGASILSRTRKLRIPDNFVVLGSHDKRAAVKNLLTLAETTPEQTLMFGDDYLDAAVKEAIPNIVFAMPNNGVFYLKPLADLISPANGGAESAFRYILDLLLFVQEKHYAQHLIQKLLETYDQTKAPATRHFASPM